MPPLHRLITIGSCYGPGRLGLVSILSRLRPGGTGPSPRRRNVSSSIGKPKLRSAAVKGTFPLIELRLAGVDSLVPRLSDPVPLIGDLIAPVSNEIALVSGPPALVVA